MLERKAEDPKRTVVFSSRRSGIRDTDDIHLVPGGEERVDLPANSHILREHELPDHADPCHR
jgi:hypothetical protein